MSNTIVNGIYGQRISGPLQVSLDPCVDFVLCELPINWETDASRLAIQLQAYRQDIPTSGLVVPTFVVDPLVVELAKEFNWAQVISAVSDLGVSQFAFAIDEDNALLRRLSPRFSNLNVRNELIQKLLLTIEILSKHMQCVVSLTVEELCPGGLDPTDGIQLAQQLVNSGAQAIIGSGGSVDFPMLKNRRQTRHKTDREDLAGWPEPWMSSAMWLLDVIKVPVFAQGQFENWTKARMSAQEFGFAGVVNISVKDPSSTLTMATLN